jgi:NAD(P)-dependent dehydrogenase (short-subunit alcohol dehydrogenase family)
MADRTALITGTSTGIGEACAARLAADGWRVYAGVRKEDDGERLVAAHEGDIVPILLDVTDQATIDAAVERIGAERGALDGVVNNAGIGIGGPTEIVEVDEWRRQFEVNLIGAVAVTRATFGLVEIANGRFVHIGSIAGRVAAPGMGPYAASKHALSGFNWALRAELSRLGRMSSSVVEPGEIKTAIWGKAQQTIDDTTAALERSGLTAKYTWLLEMSTGFLAEANEKAIEPERVAEAVEHALTAKRPKARYLVGTDAKIQSAISRLPDRGREFALGKAHGLYIRNGRKLRAG